MEHALPCRTAGTPRYWSLCMTSENHGTVGPAGCKFSHAPEKHERVLVVELPTAAGAPADQINLRLVGARKDLPVAEFEGYVDGEPLVRWMDRDNMPRVGTKLFAAPVAAQAGQVAVPEAARTSILQAVVRCGHKIDEHSVTLFANPKDPGNALSQLVDRIMAAAMQASTSGERQEGGA